MLFALLLTAAAITAFPNGVRASGSHRETTIHVDNLLRISIPAQIQNHSLDSCSMPDFEIRSESDHGIDVKGKFQNGVLNGLATVYRMGQCGGPANAGNVTFNCTLGWDKLNLTYNVKIKYGILPSSTSHVMANLTRPFGVMEVTSIPRTGPPSLKRFTVATLGQVDTDITGGLFKREFPHLRTDFIHKVIQDIQQVLQERFAVALNQAVARTPLPSELYN